MIEGIGVDVVEIGRFQRSVESFGDHFLNKIFTAKERSYSESKHYQAQHLAARFAVKEAVAKALAKGWSGGFRWKDVEVENDGAGKPSVMLYGHVKELLADRKVFVSISHSDNIVVAIAIIER